MKDPFLRDANGAACGLTKAAPLAWSDDARALMAIYLTGLSADEMGVQARRLRRRAETAARNQQYPTVTETVLRAQIAELARITTEGETR